MFATLAAMNSSPILQKNDDFSDGIWVSNSYTNEEGRMAPDQENAILSDLPAIKRQFMNEGYREGLAIGKAKVMQEGFDGGYPIGIEVGLRVGEIFGVLEGYIACKSVNFIPGMLELVQKTVAKAKTELAITELLKEVDDITLSTSNNVPDSVERKLQEWEGLVMGVRETRKLTDRKLYDESGHDLRDIVEQAKNENDPVANELIDSGIGVMERGSITGDLDGSTAKRVSFW